MSHRQWAFRCVHSVQCTLQTIDVESNARYCSAQTVHCHIVCKLFVHILFRRRSQSQSCIGSISVNFRHTKALLAVRLNCGRQLPHRLIKITSLCAPATSRFDSKCNCRTQTTDRVLSWDLFQFLFWTSHHPKSHTTTIPSFFIGQKLNYSN